MDHVFSQEYSCEMGVMLPSYWVFIGNTVRVNVSIQKSLFVRLWLSLCSPRYNMGKLNIAHHKSYHPYRRDNIERVRKDEEEARRKEESEDGRMMLAVSFL